MGSRFLLQDSFDHKRVIVEGKLLITFFPLGAVS